MSSDSYVCDLASQRSQIGKRLRTAFSRLVNGQDACRYTFCVTSSGGPAVMVEHAAEPILAQ